METKLSKTISYILKFIDSERFIASSVSNIANILSTKKCEACKNLLYKHCDCFLEYKNFKDAWYFNRIQIIMLQKKLSTKICWKVNT